MNKERYFDICREMKRLLDNVDSEDTVQCLIGNLDELSKLDVKIKCDLGYPTLSLFMNDVLAKVTEKLESEDGITNGRCISKLLDKVKSMFEINWVKAIEYPQMFYLHKAQKAYLDNLDDVKYNVYTNLEQSETIVAAAYARRSWLLSCFGSSQRRALTQADLDKPNVQKLFQNIKLLQNKEHKLIREINDIYVSNYEALKLGYRWKNSKSQEVKLKKRVRHVLQK